MSSNEPLFGFDLAQKKSLAEYVSTHGGGGGSGNVLGGIPVTPGFIAPYANGDLFVVFQGVDGYFVTNYPSDTLLQGLFNQYFEGLPGWNASVAQTLQHSNVGSIQWVDNP